MTFFLIFILLLLCCYICIPIFKAGLYTYLCVERLVNPFIRRILKIYKKRKSKILSERWYNRVERLTLSDLPKIKWEEDIQTSKGFDSFLCLDQGAEDARTLLRPDWNLSYDKTEWWKSHFTNEYLFASELKQISSPIYDMDKTDSRLHIKTGSKLDTWIYLVGKEMQPTVYSIEFDYIPHSEMQETLQLCFSAKSLANRFRFNLENNKTLKFDNVDYGFFLYWARQDLWNNHKMPCSLPLHKVTHVQLQCINNIFALFLNDELKMAVRIKDFDAKPSYWFLIFWNGIEEEVSMDMEIMNFKIIHPKRG